MVQTAIRAEMNAMHTTLEEDERQLADREHPPGERRQMALRFRIEKKRVLLAAIDALA